jgi:tol-pal system protein YbgF
MHQIRIFGIVLLALLVIGCTTEQDLLTQRKLLELQRRVDDADRTLKPLADDQSGSVRERLEILARNQADFQASLDNLRVDVQSMQGRSDDLDRTRSDMRQDLVLLRDELSLQIADLEQRLVRLEEGGSVNRSNLTATSPANMSRAPAPGVSSPTPVEESATGLYKRALAVMRDEQNYAEGRDMMATFLKRYPEDPLAINAAYWIGEAYYAEKNYEKAILQFEDVIQKYGDHPKVAAALLKQGLAFDALGDRASARLLLQRTVDRYPVSEEAKKAGATLKEWGG